MLRNTNLNLLRTLHVLLQEAHVSKAAQRLHITQSAVSRQLAQLRDIWQDELLVRNGNVLIMTPKAEMLKAKLDTLMDDLTTTPLRQLLDADLLIGVVMLRLGRYGIGVLRGDSLIASKTATRHVKNRHRAGGQSQRRFERSRERLVREIYDKACEVAQDVISPHLKELDYVMLGGERHTVNSFVKRCRFLQDLSYKTLNRRVAVDQPNHKALESIHREVWKSRVVTFEKHNK